MVMPVGKYVSLHQHSKYSLLDGMVDHVDLVKRSLELGHPASCITDHGNMFSVVNHFQAAEKAGQKPIAGFEAYVTTDHRVKGKTSASDDTAQSEALSKREHLILLAKDNDGYKRLSKICSIGFQDGFYYRPRIDDGILADVGTEGIIGTSSCLAGRIPQCLLRDDIEGAERWAIHYSKLFHGDFWLEIQPTEMADQVKVNRGIIEISKRLGIPLVASTDAHYLNREDKLTHDVLLCMQSGSTINDPNRWAFHGNTYYVMGRDEILQAFATAGHETLDQRAIEAAVDETAVIADMCNVHFDFGTHYLPKVPIPTPEEDPQFGKWLAAVKNHGKPNEDYLRYLCIKGLSQKKCTSAEYRKRLDYELGVINNMDFPDYFLIYEDIARFCRDTNLPLGPGRGCGKPGQPVNLASGERRSLENVVVGDVVVADDGNPHDVVATHVYQVSENLVKLGVEDGRSVDMTLDHKVLAVTAAALASGNAEPQWMAMADLEPGDFLCDVTDDE